VGIVAPTQANDPIAKIEQSIVSQGNTVGVASEVLQDLSRSGEWFLCIHDPVVSPQIAVRDSSRELGVLAECKTQSFEVLAAEDPREGSHREEIASWAADPAPTCGIEATGGDDAVQMDVQGEVVAPGVQHGEDARLGPEMPWVTSELEQGIGSGAEEQSVDQLRSQQRDGIHGVRERKDHMEVIDGQQFFEAGVQPSFFGQGLAFRTVSVATRAPYHALSPTISAKLSRAPEGRGAAAFDGLQRGELHSAQRPAGANTVTVGADDVGKFEPLLLSLAVRAR
jgi:hypothetical protein